MLSFSETAQNKWKRIFKKSRGNPRKRRANRSAALRTHVMTSNNIHFLMSNFSALRDLVRTYECSQLGAILLEESSHHEDIDDELVELNGFSGHWVDRPVP